MVNPKDELEFLIELQELCEKHKVKNIFASHCSDVYAEMENGGKIEIGSSVINGKWSDSPACISKRIEELENVTKQ